MTGPISRNPTTKQIRVYVKKLERYLNDLEIIPATNRARSAVLLALLSKALRVSRVVCLLVDRGFPAEAFAVSRTLIEISLYVRFISNKDTEERAGKYLKYSARIRQEWQRIIRKYYPNKPFSESYLDPAVLEMAKQFPSKAYWSGIRGQTKEMAFEDDTVETNEMGEPLRNDFDYEALYFWTGHFVHATVDGVKAHLIEEGETFRLHARPAEDEGRAGNALFNIAVFLSKMFVYALRAINLEQPQVLLDLNSQISNFAFPSASIG